MSPKLLLNLAITLALLAGVAVGGWFAGSEFLASQPEAPTTLELDTSTDTVEEGAAASVAGRVRVGYDPTADINLALVLGASGLSPFGQPEGLRGRQVLAGRVLEVVEELEAVETPQGPGTVLYHRITIQTTSGTASIRIRPDSTFLLKQGLGDASEITAGAAVALFFSDAERREVVAALVLPANSRPVLNSGLPPVRPAAPAEAEEETEGG